MDDRGVRWWPDRQGIGNLSPCLPDQIEKLRNCLCERLDGGPVPGTPAANPDDDFFTRKEPETQGEQQEEGWGQYQGVAQNRVVQ